MIISNGHLSIYWRLESELLRPLDEPLNTVDEDLS